MTPKALKRFDSIRIILMKNPVGADGVMNSQLLVFPRVKTKQYPRVCESLSQATELGHT